LIGSHWSTRALQQAEVPPNNRTHSAHDLSAWPQCFTAEIIPRMELAGFLAKGYHAFAINGRTLCRSQAIEENSCSCTHGEHNPKEDRKVESEPENLVIITKCRPYSPLVVLGPPMIFDHRGDSNKGQQQQRSKPWQVPLLGPACSFRTGSWEIRHRRQSLSPFLNSGAQSSIYSLCFQQNFFFFRSLVKQ
jgi:hypothetical protein